MFPATNLNYLKQPEVIQIFYYSGNKKNFKSVKKFLRKNVIHISLHSDELNIVTIVDHCFKPEVYYIKEFCKKFDLDKTIFEKIKALILKIYKKKGSSI